MATETTAAPPRRKETLESVVIRFAGDSGDGMQLTGTQFTNTSALVGNDLATLPGLPGRDPRPRRHARRASAGFQIHFCAERHLHAGRRARRAGRDEPGRAQDQPRRPEAERHPDRQHATRSSEKDLKKAGYAANPLEDGSLERLPGLPGRRHQAHARGAQGASGSTRKSMDRCKNFFALGMMYWLYNRPIERDADAGSRRSSARSRSSPRPTSSRCKAGYAYGETTEVVPGHLRGPAGASSRPARYRNITGNEALALGFVAAAQQAGLRALPAAATRSRPRRDILHELSKYKNFGVHHVPGRGRDRGDRRRRSARRSAARSAITTTSGPGHRAQERGDRPRDHGRAAARRSSTSSAAVPRPVCRPRPSRPTCCRRSSAATARRRCR